MTGHRVVFLYTEPTATTLDFPQLAHYIETTFPWSQVVLRESFIPFHLSPLSEEQRQEMISQLAEGMARAKVRNPSKQDQGFPPLPGEINYEKRRLSTPGSTVFGILYDGFKMMNLLAGLLPREERSLRYVHIVFTNQLFGTWEEGDSRYHARVSVYGFPSLISTTGIVEAPAKPREYYFLKQQYSALGMGDAAALGLDQEFRGRYIDYQDPRLTEVMKGYVMQVLFYHLTGDPFCEEPDCRLFNAHWQEEVIRAQLKSEQELCSFHQSLLAQLNESMG